MDAKQAALIAKDYVRKLFDGQETITNLNLEETEFDDARDEWKITLGFSRPFESVNATLKDALSRIGANPQLMRSYKVLTIGSAGEVVSMKNRSLEDA